MLKRTLGRTNIEIPLCCLGTMTFGQQNTENEGHEQMDYALERGVNFFDTAELYSIPPKAETQGSTERIIGTWLKTRQKRDKITLATKIVGRSAYSWFRENGAPTRVSPEQIDFAIERSLKNLQTDYIDLYQIHWPDRKVAVFNNFHHNDYDDDFVAFETILEAMDKHIKRGNIRYFGLSNETAWGAMKFLNEAEKNGLPRAVSIQNPYNFVNRNFEGGLSEIAQQEELSLLGYSPLGQGYLTGKYIDGARPPNTRTTLFERGDRYETISGNLMQKKYVELANSHNLSPSQLAIKFCATRSFMTSVIIGARTMDQLKHDIDAFDAPWSNEIEREVNLLHQSCPNPCP